MISKKVTKLVKSLHLKKHRQGYGLFLTEGAKSVLELLNSNIEVKTLIGTEVFLKEHSNLLQRANVPEICAADEKTLSAISTFKHSNAALAVASIPTPPKLQLMPHEYVLVLDDVRDPGNLGTLIRIADWYGIRKIVCSPETTDVYNPKVISASMGSFLRVQLWYQELAPFLSGCSLPVYGAFLQEAQDIHDVAFEKGGVLLLGNESEGIHKELSGFVTKRIFIPRYGEAESLNVAMAAAVICDNVRRHIKTTGTPDN